MLNDKVVLCTAMLMLTSVSSPGIFYSYSFLSDREIFTFTNRNFFKCCSICFEHAHLLYKYGRNGTQQNYFGFH